MRIVKHIPLLVLLTFLAVNSHAQNVLSGGQVSGNIQLDGQISHADSVIGSSDVPTKLLMNARADILYTNGPFSAGLRFEAYQKPMLGFDPRYEGQGIANYFASYQNDKLSVTAGNYYEQFGNGLILRSYEDRFLGIDNSLFGFSVNYRPWDGVTLKGIIGKQRFYWEYGKGFVRGLDAEVALNNIIKSWTESKTRITLGGGFVSKYEDNDVTIISRQNEYALYKLALPANVGAGSVRMELSHGGWGLQAEYAYKSQDPNEQNHYIYKNGDALFVSASYSQKGFSANLQAKRVDNIGFRSERNPNDKTGQMLYINYVPSITKQHTYAFLSMYPYATQTTGEMGLQGDLMFKLKKETLLGGKYGTDIHINTAVITSLDTSNIGGMGTDGYTSPYFGPGDLYYGDVSVEIARKLSGKSKITATYGYVVFNPIVEGHAGHLHHNNIIVCDYTYKINKKNVLRMEAEWMGSDSKYDVLVDDKRCGDWVMGLVEYNFTSAFFISLSDQYCYHDGIGNYPNVSIGYTRKASRLQIGYGKQREGIVCIGGVCRQVPASNGLTFSLTTSF
jgi:hypothetical protein